MKVKLKSGKVITKKSNKKVLGAAALVGGAIKIGSTLIKNKQEKDALAKKTKLEKDLAIQSIMNQSNMDDENDQTFYNQNPELIHGVSTEIQALGKKGKPVDLSKTQSIPELEFVYKRKPVVPIDIKPSNKYSPSTTSDWTYYDAQDKWVSNKRDNKGKLIQLSPEEFHAQNPDIVTQAGYRKKAMGAKGLNPLSSDAAIVNAGSHESGNDLDLGDMQVEGEEIVRDNGDVMSDRVNGISIAEYGESLASIKGALEKASRRLNNSQRGDVKNIIRTIDKDMDEAVAKQELIKDNMGLNDDGSEKSLGFSYMGDIVNKQAKKMARKESFDLFKKNAGNFLNENENLITSGVDAGVSVLDNILNARLLKQTPEIPTPVYNKAANLKTKIDVSPQIRTVNEERDKFDEVIDENTRSSNTAIQRKRANKNSAVKAINDINSKKANIEVGLENQDAMNKQQVRTSNVYTGNQFSKDKQEREVDIISAKSQNNANLSGDLTSVVDKFRMANFQDKQLLNDSLNYSDTGANAKAVMSGKINGFVLRNYDALLKQFATAGRRDAIKWMYKLQNNTDPSDEEVDKIISETLAN